MGCRDFDTVIKASNDFRLLNEADHEWINALYSQCYFIMERASNGIPNGSLLYWRVDVTPKSLPLALELFRCGEAEDCDLSHILYTHGYLLENIFMREKVYEKFLKMNIRKETPVVHILSMDTWMTFWAGTVSSNYNVNIADLVNACPNVINPI